MWIRWECVHAEVRGLFDFSIMSARQEPSVRLAGRPGGHSL